MRRREDLKEMDSIVMNIEDMEILQKLIKYLKHQLDLMMSFSI